MSRSSCLFGAGLTIGLIGAAMVIQGLGYIPCAIARGAVNNPSVTEKSNGGNVSIYEGDTLTLRLEAQPGTGYGWHIAKKDELRLKLCGKPEFVKRGESDLVGDAEEEVFKFKAKEVGKTTVELHYRRAFEKAADQTFVLHVAIVQHEPAKLPKE